MPTLKEIMTSYSSSSFIAPILSRDHLFVRVKHVTLDWNSQSLSEGTESSMFLSYCVNKSRMSEFLEHFCFRVGGLQIVALTNEIKFLVRKQTTILKMGTYPIWSLTFTTALMSFHLLLLCVHATCWKWRRHSR